MVVVEGPDGAGKSVLVNQLADRFGLEVGQRGVVNRDELYKVTRQDTYRALALEVQGTKPPCIWDRLFVSEFVYADIVGRPCEFSIFEASYVKSVMDVLSFPMIACLPPFEVVRENVAQAHQMKGVKEGLDKIYDRYDHAALPWPDNLLWYDYTGSHKHWATLDDIEEEVAGYLQSRMEREAWD